MKKYMRLLSVLWGLVGIGMLFLSVILGLGIVVTIISMVMVTVGIVGALVSNTIEETSDITSWSTRPDDGVKKPTSDKGQLPLGGYTSVWA